ncbi:MAG: hypothetical protein HC804_14315 [Anaerolineae bacterium]|nr:hypothetical protein [Anaerolineae bacterium]
MNAVYATVESAKATATAVGHAASSGERVNATQVPAAAPQIIYFFASAPSQESMQAGMRYHLNYTVQNANRVEIFGNVMDNPQEGSFPIYNTPASDDWVLWAGNDQAWVEQFLQVRPDADTGSVLQNVTVNSNAITLTFRDPQFVDGDVIDVDVNGVRVLDRYVTQGRYVSFPIMLNSGANTVTINARNVGVTPPNVTEIVVSNVIGGPGSQVTRGLNLNETQSFTITAP